MLLLVVLQTAAPLNTQQREVQRTTPRLQQQRQRWQRPRIQLVLQTAALQHSQQSKVQRLTPRLLHHQRYRLRLRTLLPLLANASCTAGSRQHRALILSLCRLR
jgi:hypothetical protein